MFMFKFMGLFAFAYAAVLLTVSFFVLFSLRKVETQGLKAFGYVVTALLWIAALLIFSAGLYSVSSGFTKGRMMQGMLKARMSGMVSGPGSPMMSGCKQKMDKGAMPQMMQEKAK